MQPHNNQNNKPSPREGQLDGVVGNFEPETSPQAALAEHEIFARSWVDKATDIAAGWLEPESLATYLENDTSFEPLPDHGQVAIEAALSTYLDSLDDYLRPTIYKIFDVLWKEQENYLLVPAETRQVLQQSFPLVFACVRIDSPYTIIPRREDIPLEDWRAAIRKLIRMTGSDQPDPRIPFDTKRHLGRSGPPDYEYEFVQMAGEVVVVAARKEAAGTQGALSNSLVNLERDLTDHVNKVFAYLWNKMAFQLRLDDSNLTIIDDSLLNSLGVRNWLFNGQRSFRNLDEIVWRNFTNFASADDRRTTILRRLAEVIVAGNGTS